MKNRESYMHYYAKEILQKWLISAWKYNDKNSYENKLYILEWLIDHKEDNYGIRLEYPILVKKSGNHVMGVDHVWSIYPDLNKLSDDVKVEAVLDVAIIENGSLKYGLEVVHKHTCSQYKRDFLKRQCPTVKIYEISAEWILNQLNEPIPPKILPLFSLH
jgi:hypothetical protein